MTQTIKAIFGHEPMREKEYPTAYLVGSDAYSRGVVTRIEFGEQSFGDHGLGWFKVFVGDKLISEVAARAVAEVQFD